MNYSRTQPRITGDKELIDWSGHPKEAAYRQANNGMGMCNTGSGFLGCCVFGGIGCNVDHVRIARENLSNDKGEPNG